MSSLFWFVGKQKGTKLEDVKLMNQNQHSWIKWFNSMRHNMVKPIMELSDNQPWLRIMFDHPITRAKQQIGIQYSPCFIVYDMQKYEQWYMSICWLSLHFPSALTQTSSAPVTFAMRAALHPLLMSRGTRWSLSPAWAGRRSWWGWWCPTFVPPVRHFRARIFLGHGWEIQPINDGLLMVSDC